MKAVATIVVEMDVGEPGLEVSVDSVRQSIEEYFYTINDMVGNMEMSTMVVYSEMGYKIDSKAEVHCPPRVGEQLIMSGKVYTVCNVIHDFDAREFVVIVEESEKFNKFIKR